MRQPLVAGNWKMNGSKAFVAELLMGIKASSGGIQATELAVCAPFPYLYLLEELLAGTPIRYGAQDVAFENDGAFTGQVSVKMLKDFGCHYVIIGHSERRQFNAETDAMIARKYAQAIANELTPILCVGESLTERQQGQTEAIVARHLDAVIELNGVDALAKGVIAYEPVWAIGTGLTATPEQAQEVHAFLRTRIAAHSQPVASQVRILYGGSMKSNNALELIMQPDIDGGLIGGASLKADEFLAICQAGDAAVKATAV
ncbi:triose-phosphate isomerase [Rhodoferax sp. 4810]|uniref:Triosephosphate isomerase n=1 Tax=Thiospirillum jenense TaxID=1653858 RepID=A0A839HEF7_9GAMM|nr:triose-phosphate isomerase [Thiospirillum jenense]MBB1074295.1 triose-phosphate isomerase [Rhodoferax jenense]MBB1126500.1 triose-phosphate isomerase [Thiospirillum jenense]